MPSCPVGAWVFISDCPIRLSMFMILVCACRSGLQLTECTNFIVHGAQIGVPGAYLVVIVWCVCLCVDRVDRVDRAHAYVIVVIFFDPVLIFLCNM